jgi:AraC family transcriptional regulator, transcriptional activator of pobA
MNKDIPTYQLMNLTRQGGDSGVFLLNQRIDRPGVAINIPYRRDFYAVGICLRGQAELNVNLEAYTITPDCLIAKPPHTINQWTCMSDDFETLTIFFTNQFINANNALALDKFAFFDSVARHIIPVTDSQSATITACLRGIQQKYDSQHPYRTEMLKNQISNLLYEVAAIYDYQRVVSPMVQTRSQVLATEFRKLVTAHGSTQRSVKFYADELAITPKYLSGIVKETTGKTAGESIEEIVILEAKVLLQNPALAVSQIADRLHFPDSATFSKFFKKSTGLSPLAYKQAY